MDPHASAQNNRRMAICIFRKIKAIRDDSLNACRRKKKSRIILY